MSKNFLYFFQQKKVISFARKISSDPLGQSLMMRTFCRWMRHRRSHRKSVITHQENPKSFLFAFVSISRVRPPSSFTPGTKSSHHAAVFLCQVCCLSTSCVCKTDFMTVSFLFPSSKWLVGFSLIQLYSPSKICYCHTARFANRQQRHPFLPIHPAIRNRETHYQNPKIQSSNPNPTNAEYEVFLLASIISTRLTSLSH